MTEPDTELPLRQRIARALLDSSRDGGHGDSVVVSMTVAADAVLAAVKPQLDRLTAEIEQRDSERRAIGSAMRLEQDPDAASIVHWAESHVASSWELGWDLVQVRAKLLPVLKNFPFSAGDVQGDDLKAGYIAKVAADVLMWSKYQLERWEATFGRTALPHATAVIEERDRLRQALAQHQALLAEVQAALPSPGACSCNPTIVAVHEPGSYCGDAQFEAIVGDVRATVDRNGDEWDEEAVQAVLDFLRRAHDHHIVGGEAR